MPVIAAKFAAPIDREMLNAVNPNSATTTTTGSTATAIAARSPLTFCAADSAIPAAMIQHSVPIHPK
ncbi:MAG: hypothetical protein HND58_18160 [Planctomycetota bacterium]|nr:MAG: hypothetical protein HND58_18160 [Planctomycetota bacterium]